jgi:hypothetical protein
MTSIERFLLACAVSARGRCMRPRARAAALLALALLFTAVVWGRGGGEQAGGPLTVSDEAGIVVHLGAGALATWGMGFSGDSGGEIVLKAIEPVSVRGVEVLGVSVCRWRGVPEPDGTYHDCAPVSAYEWPPSGVTLLPVAGTVMAADSRPSVSMVIGVKVESPGEGMGIQGVRIVYRSHGRTYEAVEPWSFLVLPPEPGTSS